MDTPYANTVYCNVYRTHQRGIKSLNPLTPVAGNLVLYRVTDNINRTFRHRATLLGPDGQSVIPLLDQTVVQRISEGAGIVISGTEWVARSASIKSKIERYPQTWWCEVLAAQPLEQVHPTVEVRTKPRWQIATCNTPMKNSN